MRVLTLWHEFLLMAMKFYQLKNVSTVMKRLTSVALVSLLFAACQKDLDYQMQGSEATTQEAVVAPVDANTGYYVKFKTGNDEASFQYDAKAVLAESGTAKSLLIQGSAVPGESDKESIRLYLSFLNGSPAVGTYKQGDPSFNYLVSGSFNPGTTEFSYSAGLTPSTELPLTITISSIENGIIKGSFKGAFYKHDLKTGVLSSKEYIQYTDGEFNLPVY